MFVFSQDFTVFEEGLGEVFAEKIHKLMDLALKVGALLVGINDGAGARIQEGVVSLDSYGGIFYRNVQSSGVVPQISVIMGPCAGGAVYSPAMTDFVFMVEDTSYMFITGPDVVKTVTGEEVTQQELGGAIAHGAEVGGLPLHLGRRRAVPSRTCATCSATCRRTTWRRRPSSPRPTIPPGCAPSRATSSPRRPTTPTTCTRSSRRWSTTATTSSTPCRWAPNMVCAYARLDGHVVGIVGNQPMHLAGVLIESSEKAARFVRTCDAFNIPLVSFVDVPGFLPGVDQEHGGIIRHGAKLLRLLRVDRAPHPGGHPQHLRRGLRGHELQADRRRPRLRLALGRAGGHGASRARSRSPTGGEIVAASDPDARKAELVEERTERFANPYQAADRGYVDDVIDPADTRVKLIAGLDMLRSKREDLPKRKHGNVPCRPPDDGRTHRHHRGHRSHRVGHPGR